MQALELLRERVKALERAGLGRRLVGVGPATGTWAEVQGRRVLLMCTNDYLGLARHPALAQAAAEAAMAWGVGSGASRLVAGTLDGHLALEEALARFKRTESAVFFATGYMANLGAVAGLAGKGDFIVSDELNHASLIDACRLSRAEVRVYPHCDADAAARALEDAPAGALKLIVTDAVFSMDGDLAPLKELADIARAAGALLVVDEAHATGVWGPGGRGLVEELGLEGRKEIVIVATASKAMGALGGFVAGAQEVKAAIVHRARSLLYTTAPPPTQVAAVARALEIIAGEEGGRLRQRLWDNCRLMRGLLGEAGLRVWGQGPIVPVVVGEARRAMAMARALLARGVFAPPMRPPTVPEGTSRVRLSLSAAHTPEEVEMAAGAIIDAAREVGLCRA